IAIPYASANTTGITTAVCATNPSPDSHSSTPSPQFRNPPTRPAYGAPMAGRPRDAEPATLDTPVNKWTPGRLGVDDVRMVLQQNEEAGEAPPPAPLTVTAPVPYAPSGALRTRFPPIADYAFLSDCEN